MITGRLVRWWREKGTWSQAALLGLTVVATSWLLAGVLAAVAVVRCTPWPGPYAALAGAVAGVVGAGLVTVYVDVYDWANRRRVQGRHVPPVIGADSFQLVFGALVVSVIAGAAVLLAAVQP